MSGWYPPNLQWAEAVANNGANVGGFVVAALLAAPGAGFRYRVWAVTFTTYIVPNAPGNSRVLVRNVAAANNVTQLGRTGFFTEHILLPGGLVSAANGALEFWVWSAVANIDYLVNLYYTTEAV